MLMRCNTVCVLLSLLLITTTLAGCLHEGDVGDEDSTIVGDWYQGEQKALIINGNGTLLGDLNGDNTETGTWSDNGNGTIDLKWDTHTSASTVWFVVDGDWLFLNNDEYSNCEVMSRVSMENDAWSSTVDALTLPQICEGIGFDEPENPQYQYGVTDHSSQPSNGTNDELMNLFFVTSPGAINWTNLTVQITNGDGVSVICTTDNSTDCAIIQSGSDDNHWEVLEILQIAENGADLCSGPPCEFTIKIIDIRTGINLLGNDAVIVE